MSISYSAGFNLVLEILLFDGHAMRTVHINHDVSFNLVLEILLFDGPPGFREHVTVAVVSISYSRFFSLMANNAMLTEFIRIYVSISYSRFFSLMEHPFGSQ